MNVPRGNTTPQIFPTPAPSTSISHANPPVGTGADETAPLTLHEAFATFALNTIRGPLYLCEDIRNHPVISTGIIAGTIGLSLSGLFGPIEDAIFLGGELLAVGMITYKGIYKGVKAYEAQDRQRLTEAARDFSLGTLSLFIMGATVGCMEGLKSFGLLPPIAPGQSQEPLVRAVSSVLHCGDDIAVVSFSCREALRLIRSRW